MDGLADGDIWAVLTEAMADLRLAKARASYTAHAPALYAAESFSTARNGLLSKAANDASLLSSRMK